MASPRVNKPELPGADPGPHGSTWFDPRKIGLLRSFLIFVPVAIVARFAGAPDPALFALASLAIIPLASVIGETTESLACRLGPGVGGLLNATFGNAAELIIALFALFHGLDSVVKASLTGSIIGNLLLVLGASLFAGGTRHPIQRFNRTAAGTGGTLMVLAASSLLVPALFHNIVGADQNVVEHNLSFSVAVVLMIAYILNLVFCLITHKDVFNPDNETAEPIATEERDWTVRGATTVLLVATGFVAWMSEILVGAVETTSHAVGLTEVFVGVIVVAIVGNAAEHSTAILMALKNKMDLAVGIALGSASQIALFVAPVLVFVSYARPHPMDLIFTHMEVMAMVLAVMLARMVAEDGESNWLEGAMLLLIYAVLGLAFYYLPAHADHATPRMLSEHRTYNSPPWEGGAGGVGVKRRSRLMAPDRGDLAIPQESTVILYTVSGPTPLDGVAPHPANPLYSRGELYGAHARGKMAHRHAVRHSNANRSTARVSSRHVPRALASCSRIPAFRSGRPFGRSSCPGATHPRSAY